MNITVSRGNPKDTEISIPASKSLTHRALITAALAEGTSRITAPVENQDTEATLRCLGALGAVWERDGKDLIIHGSGGCFGSAGTLLDCGESGSTLRFMIPIFAMTPEEYHFSGHGRLMSRPQTVYEETFREQGLMFERQDGILKVRGPLSAGSYRIRGDISSQFISGLLFALPLAEGDSVIEIIPPYESESYVDLTLSALADAGIEIEREHLKYHVRGSQKYRPLDTRIEGDASQAAFFIALSMMRQVPLNIVNLNHHSRQGDAVMLKLAEQFGAEVKEIAGGYRIIPHTMKAVNADLSDCPDLGPVLFAAAARAEGTSCFTGCERLRIKESDRIAAMEEELAKTGCRMHSEGGTVYVEGTEPYGAAVYGHNDHRIVMAMSVLAASMDEPVVIEGCEAVAKSYPEFFRDLAETGAKTE